MVTKKEGIFNFLALGFCLGLAINLAIIFFLAFFNGGQVLVTVNTFGEQWVEAVLFPIFIIMGVFSLIRLGLKLKW